MAQSLIERIQQYCLKAGIQENTLGVNILGDPYLIERVRDGRCMFITLKKIEEYLKANPPNQRRRRGRPPKQESING